MRLLRIRFTNTAGKLHDAFADQYAFLIEPDDELEMRHDAKLVQLPGVSMRSLNEHHTAMMFVFQYLIGNTDWSLVTPTGDEFCCHNGRLLQVDAELYYVPYDFDLAGLVDARYAKPDRSVGIRRVTQRRYRGYCTSPTALRTALQAIKARRAEILRIPAEIPGLTQIKKARLSRYLNAFFEESEDEEKLLRSFEKRCLGSRWPAT